MTLPAYPLAEVIQIKKRRVEKQEKVVQQKREVLAKEQEKLRQREKERDVVLNHYKEKLQQLRDELDGETTSEKIKPMKVYLKEVQERLKVEEKKVKDQQELVKLAERDLAEAIEELRIKRLEVDKLLTHRVDWLKEAKIELDIQEGREQDEMGQIIFQKNKRDKQY
jgi:hypothetical protein